mgnify:CR=1 FL=1
MKLKEIFLSLAIITLFSSCASGYKTINPNTINYLSTSDDNGVKLEYKYELLNKKRFANNVYNSLLVKAYLRKFRWNFLSVIIC